jgi:F420-0:gamma-glutamyl ligase
MSEADEILGGVSGFLLTQKDGVLTSNAGVDMKNSPRGTAMLWPGDPDDSATDLRNALERWFHAKIGVEIVDSRVTPLRLGTTGLAVGVSGFRSIIDQRGKQDLYGRKVRVTQSNFADDVAAAAHMLMGETKERVGAVVVRNAQIAFHARGHADHLKLSRDKCLITNSIHS